MIEKKLNPNFSVSISVYINDDPNHFNIALNSIFNQSLPPAEVVLVVDGPITQNLKDVIKEFENKKDSFKVIWLEENRGHGEARRIGLENCTYDIVALMDSDDICDFNRFEKQLKVLESNFNISIVGGYIEEFDDDNLIVGIRKVPLNDLEIKEYMKSRCPMNQVSVMFRKSEVQKAGGYLDWYNNEDYYLWIRMMMNGSIFMNLEDILVKVRVNKSMYKRRGGWKYFRSEAKLQKYMYNNNIIGFMKYSSNIFIRLIVQVILPNNIRQFLFVKLFRD